MEQWVLLLHAFASNGKGQLHRMTCNAAAAWHPGRSTAAMRMNAWGVQQSSQHALVCMHAVACARKPVTHHASAVVLVVISSAGQSQVVRWSQVSSVGTTTKHAPPQHPEGTN